jgi:hypothetical protein
MNEEVATKRGGGKLNRSETVTVRLDPKLNYLCELAARAQRRTKSSFIEWAVADSLRSVILPEVVEYGDAFGDTRDVSLQEKASQLWHVDEADRVAALALTAPALLNHDEQLVWRLVRENGLLWRGHYDSSEQWCWIVKEDSLIKDRLREHWDTFKAVAVGDKSSAALPSWAKQKPNKWGDDIDPDEVPF